MPTKIQGAMSLDDLFSNNNIYRIPEYQRDYSWEQEDAELLFSDIFEYFNEKKLGDQSPEEPFESSPYFLGTIVLMKMKNETEGQPDKPIEIVDGQQRMITLAVLFCCLRDLETDEARKARLDNLVAIVAGQDEPIRKFLVKKDMQDFIDESVFSPGAILQSLPEEIENEAFEKLGIVRNRLKNIVILLDSEDRAEFAEYLLSHCFVAVVVSSDQDRAYQIFSRINKRGVDLDRGDILKAEVIGAIPANSRPAYLEVWDLLKKNLGRDFDGTHSRKGLFSRISDLHGKDKTRIMENIRGLVAKNGAEPFMNEIFIPYGVAYNVLVNSKCKQGTSRQNDEINHYLACLGWNKSQNWEAPTILWLIANKKHPDRILEYVRALERYVMAETLLNKNGGGLNSAKYFEQLSRDILDPHKDIDPQSLFPIDENKGTWCKKIIEKGLTSHAGKIVLLRLHCEISGVPTDQCTGYLTADYNLEHVLPKKPANKRGWPGFANKHAQYAPKIGNLYLIGRRLNTTLKSKDWKSREVRGRNTKGKQQLLRERSGEIVGPQVDYVTNSEKWDANIVNKRHAALMKLVKKIWGFG